MAKRIELNPAWLVSLLNQWSIRQIPGHQLGYNSGSKWMTGLKASPASSIDPTGFAARDFSDLEAALTWLKEADKPLLAAILMYYRPWTVETGKAEGWPFANSTYYERLHRGHAVLAKWMDDVKRARDTVRRIVATSE